jgi:hypothetical protein
MRRELLGLALDALVPIREDQMIKAGHLVIEITHRLLLPQKSLRGGRPGALLVPFAADQMEAFPVNPYVSNAKNEGPRCIEPAVA